MNKDGETRGRWPRSIPETYHYYRSSDVEQEQARARILGMIKACHLVLNSFQTRGWEMILSLMQVSRSSLLGKQCQYRGDETLADMHINKRHTAAK